MTLSLFAVVILLTAGQPPQEIVVEVYSVVDVLISAEAHPNLIELSVVPPYPVGGEILLTSCPQSTTCFSSVRFVECGVYQFPGTVRYLFPTPSGELWTIDLNAIVTVVGCNLFADGFETGTTEGWSSTRP